MKDFRITKFLLLLSYLVFVTAAPTDNNYYVQDPKESQDSIEFSATLNFTTVTPFPPVCETKKSLKFLVDKPEEESISSKRDIIPGQFPILDLSYSLDTNEIHHIKITANNQKRWEVPKYVLSEEYNGTTMKTSNVTMLNDYFRYTKEPVALVLKNPKTREEFLSIGRTTLVFRDDYISFDYQFTSDFISGYGERSHNFKLTPGMYTSFANDTGLGSIIDDGLGGKNLYGQQPFILHRTKKGTFVGILFFNTNAQDLVIFKPDKWDFTYAEQRTIGGVLDIYAWTRDTPLAAIQTYHELIGRPSLPPFWSLGWHQCKYGYKDEDEWTGVVDKYKANDLPLDTMWLDIDYMKKYYDFTVDDIEFGDLNAIVKQFQAQDLQVVPILDIGIPIDPTDKYTQLGNQLKTFIMSNYTEKPLINSVWPGKTYFPDFTNPNSKKLWETGLNDFYQKVSFNGIWLDMNEPGMINSDPVGEQDVNIVPAKNMYNDLFYTPGNGNIHLERHSISLNALTYGDDKSIYTIYNVKPLNPFNQNKLTSNYLRNSLNKRPFVLSRSTFAGMGKYSHHWLGDNYSTWDSLKKSIPGVFNFQMFGFNLVGADICGFLYDTTDHLCSRWQSLGAFYPFARNHNDIHNKDQHPYNVGPLTLEATRRTLNIRYALLRYMYSEHFMSSKNGGVVFQPLMFQFPKDKEALNHIDTQVMVGPSLMLAPALEQDTDDYDAYIPNSNWNNLFNKNDLDFKSLYNFDPKATKGKTAKLSGAYDNLNLFFRGGRILPLQFNSNKVRRSKELLGLKTTLIVNPDEKALAEGDLVFDDDASYTIENGTFIHVHMKLLKDVITFNTTNKYVGYINKDVLIDQIKILRTDLIPNINRIVIKDRFYEDIQFEYNMDPDNKVLNINFPGDVRVDDIRFVYLNKTPVTTFLNIN